MWGDSICKRCITTIAQSERLVSGLCGLIFYFGIGIKDCDKLRIYVVISRATIKKIN